MRRLRRALLGCGLGVVGLLGALAGTLVPPEAGAQPVQWSLRPAPGGGRMAADRLGNIYVRAGLTKLDAAGRVLWSVPGPRWPCESAARCSNDIAGWEVGDDGTFLAVNGVVGPMTCALGCGGGNLFLQPSDGGALVSLYSTPFTEPPSAALAGVATGPGGELVTFGHDVGGGYFVRLRPTPLERRYGTRMTAAAVLPSGAIVVAGSTGLAGFVRRYDAAGSVEWTVGTSDPAGCGKLALDGVGRVACLSRPASLLGAAGEWRGVVDLVGPTGIPIRMGLARDVNDLAFDAGGHLWTAGVDCGGTCASLRKYDAAGTLVAAATDDAPDRWSAWLALAIAPNGDVYVTGLSRPSPAGSFMPSDMVTARFDAAAVRRWRVAINGAADWNDYGVDVLTSGDGAIASGWLTESGVDATTPILVNYGAAVLEMPGFALGVAPNPVQVGQTVAMTATLSGATAPTGTVRFNQGSTVLCAAVPLQATSATHATATCSFAAAAGGTQRLGAAYSGDANYAAVDGTIDVTVIADVPALSPASLALLAALLAVGATRALTLRGDGQRDVRRR